MLYFTKFKKNFPLLRLPFFKKDDTMVTLGSFLCYNNNVRPSMKKKLTKKLVLNKKTISSLSENDMNLVRGATFNFYCTDSCSLNMGCCPPTTEENVIVQLPDEGQG